MEEKSSGTLLASLDKGHAVFCWTALSKQEQLDALEVLKEVIEGDKLNLFYRVGSRTGQTVLIRQGDHKRAVFPEPGDLDLDQR